MVVALLAVAWLVALRPASLGGSTGYVVVPDSTMEPAFHDDDIVLARRHPVYEVGDVIAYEIPAGQQGAGRRVVSRIVGGSAGEGYRTRGDNRAQDDPWRPKPADIIGSSAHHLPWLGRLVAVMRTPAALGVLGGLLTAALIWRWESEQDDGRDRNGVGAEG